jgi:hypothetical protein
MENGIEDAEFVLVIFTETYNKRITGKEKEGIGFGCRFEGKVVYNSIYNSASRNNKFCPVLFNEQDKQYIPTLLGGDNYYCIGLDLLAES